MPYHLGKSSSCPKSKPHAVLRDDGTVVPGGCHPSHGEALRHQRALMVNVPDATGATSAAEATLFEHPCTWCQSHREVLEDIAKNYSTDQRRDMAKSGQALPDGSFPIKDCGDVADAIPLVGRYKGPHDARAHVIRRAKSLGCSLPEGWG